MDMEINTTLVCLGFLYWKIKLKASETTWSNLTSYPIFSLNVTELKLLIRYQTLTNFKPLTILSFNISAVILAGRSIRNLKPGIFGNPDQQVGGLDVKGVLS